jgi:hypothetical protein
MSIGETMMAGIFEARNLSVSINRRPREVYDFASVPENFPKWATGLGKSLRKMNDEWIAETPQGPMKVRFTERNDFGVLDHYVIPKPDKELYIPMRVIANGTGSELIFTLFRPPDMPDEKYAEDAEWVMRDLNALKKLLEV